jgi:hypothetical protein
LATESTTPSWWRELLERAWQQSNGASAGEFAAQATQRKGGLQPLSRIFGLDRGRPVDRVYIERFLEAHRHDIRGRVLEIGDDSYTRTIGGSNVARSDVLHASGRNPGATYVDDLSKGDTLPSAAFDCVILTQTLQFIYDMPAAVRTLRRILAPGGTILATMPWITQIQDEEWRDSWHWSMTDTAARHLFEAEFAAGVEVFSYGNLSTAIAFLLGMTAEEVPAAAFEEQDRDFPLIVAVRARGATASG